ncbi:fatty acid-binding heart [Brachionus plicatilis]|uniref:Fatty acid-binding heart n=1 Tax=Brachionus plicatilis TaxID=10195 RepID=A0A3M7R760_BRAPC|nr:fatty acid-binding heart [Brachionus plicatilis]
MSELNGTWVLESKENFEEFLKALGVGIILRKIAKNITPTLIIKSEGNKWSIKLRSSFKSLEYNFNLEEEFDDETIDGKKAKFLFKLEGNKLITEQRDFKSRELITTVEKYVDKNGYMIEHLCAKNVVAKRTFKRAS